METQDGTSRFTKRQAAVIAYARNTCDVEKGFHKRQMQETTREIDTIQGKLNKLMDLLLEGAIEKAEHDEKRASLRSRQVDLTNLMNSYHSADDGFRDAVVDMLELSKKAHELFVSSNNQGKRRLINFVFSNLSLKGNKLAYSLRQPFDQFVNAVKIEEWRARQESNL